MKTLLAFLWALIIIKKLKAFMSMRENRMLQSTSQIKNDF